MVIFGSLPWAFDDVVLQGRTKARQNTRVEALFSLINLIVLCRYRCFRHRRCCPRLPCYASLISFLVPLGWIVIFVTASLSYKTKIGNAANSRVATNKFNLTNLLQQQLKIRRNKLARCNKLIWQDKPVTKTKFGATNSRVVTKIFSKTNLVQQQNSVRQTRACNKVILQDRLAKKKKFGETNPRVATK